MMQSTSHWSGLHVAIIMDGNGRWATRQHLPRSVGHQAGASAVRRVVQAAPKQGIRVLTLYAFSADNWKRPADEVTFLMRLFLSFLRSESLECAKNDIRVNVIGRRDRLAPSLIDTIEQAEQLTSAGRTLLLRIAVDYSSRDSILATAGQRSGTREEFRSRLAHSMACVAGSPDVDLLIRTGEERRLSDFLLWELAYAELFFCDTLWPDFDETGLRQAVDEYSRRDRRFGALPMRAVV